MFRKLRVLVSNEQRLVWCELLQWCNMLFVFFVVTQIAMASGLWIVSTQVKPFLLGHNSDVLPSLLLTSSLITICLSTVGYSGAMHSASPLVDERFYAIKTLMWFELMGFILGIVCFILGVTSFTIVHGDIVWAAERGLKSHLDHYSSSPGPKELMDRLQTKYKCCGVTSYRDWFSIPWQTYTSRGAGVIEDTVPWSCCSPQSAKPCVHTFVTKNIKHKAYTYPTDVTLYTQGCVEAITKYLGHHMFYICGGLMIFLSVILVVISIWSRLLETSITNAYTIGDPECTTWGYFLVNYGPDIEDLYEEIDQSDESSWDSDYEEEEVSEYGDEEEQEEEVLTVSGSQITAGGKSQQSVLTENADEASPRPPTPPRTPKPRPPTPPSGQSTAYQSSDGDDSAQESPNINNNRESWGILPPPPPSPPPNHNNSYYIPIPPPLPQVDEDTMSENLIPPIPPLPFQ